MEDKEIMQRIDALEWALGIKIDRRDSSKNNIEKNRINASIKTMEARIYQLKESLKDKTLLDEE